jgi:hypothetical protein
LGIDFEIDKEGKPSGKSKQSESEAPARKIENPAKHAEQSSIQPGRNGDGRKSEKTKRAEKQKRIESGFKEE